MSTGLRPCLKLFIQKINSRVEDRYLVIDAIIDTGFDGFVMVNPKHAKALGWANHPAKGNSRVTIADGSSSSVSLMQHPVKVGSKSSKEIRGMCLFSENPRAPCLIGMDYLRRAKLVLLISVKGIVLIEEDKLSEGVRIKVEPVVNPH